MDSVKVIELNASSDLTPDEALAIAGRESHRFTSIVILAWDDEEDRGFFKYSSTMTDSDRIHLVEAYKQRLLSGWRKE